jgi:hypothetical protein
VPRARGPSVPAHHGEARRRRRPGPGHGGSPRHLSRLIPLPPRGHTGSPCTAARRCVLPFRFRAMHATRRRPTKRRKLDETAKATCPPRPPHANGPRSRRESAGVGENHVRPYFFQRTTATFLRLDVGGPAGREIGSRCGR